MKRLPHLLLVPALVGSFIAAVAAPARADEGMWTFNNAPRDRIKARYGFNADDKWLEHVRLASARIAGGCSASFVSESGLVMTNHHCARSCIQHLSTAEKDLTRNGFYAKAQAEEARCPEMEINQLFEITDVTERLAKATKGLSDKAYNDALKAEMSRIEKECQTSDAFRCDVVTLYHGGAYNLYKYRRFQDVRLVFAPEESIAFFGGDPDNFEFPRYDLDVSFLRVYDGGKPAKMDHFFKWSPAGARDGDLTFVSGHPGGTSRQLTVAELEYLRDTQLPERLVSMAQLRGELTQFQKRGPEQKRISQDYLFGIENSFKAIKGRWATLLDKRFFESKVAEEKALRDKLARDPALAKQYGPAFDAIARAIAAGRDLRKPFAYMEAGAATRGSDLFSFARTLVRAADELPKPNDKRLREYRDSALPVIKQRLFTTAPIHDELEVLMLTFGLTKMREELGADHAFVKKVLGKESPEELATRLIKNTKLKDVATRKALFAGGKKAVDASDDPLIQLVRAIDADGRQIRKRYEDEIESVMKRSGEAVARARFAVEGMSSYPDATFTLRLSYGAVKGYRSNGRDVKPFTTLGGAFERATGRPPFDLPKSWIDAKPRLDMNVPMNFVTTNDIIGGNSGSPMFDKEGRVVGLVFDGNIESLGGDYWFDEATNRTIAVHSEALIHALGRIYGADRIVQELRPGAKTSQAR